MGVRFPSVFTTAFIGPLPANANETIIYTTPGLNLPIDNAAVLLFWGFACIVGTSTTGLILTLRRGPLVTSPTFQGSPWGTAVTAGVRSTSSGAYVDNPGIVAEQQYTLTVQQTGATAAATQADGYLMAMVL